MSLRWGRIAAGALVAESIPILALVVLVAVAGLPDQASAEAYANHLGRWVGPVAGALATFAAAWWVARPVPGAGLRHGLLLGALTAALDGALLVAGETPFEWLFVLSNLSRIGAGALGGCLRARYVTRLA